VENEDSSKID
jgi:hypothetical protein